MLLMCNAATPVLERETVAGALELPRAMFGNVRLVGANPAATSVKASPLKAMRWGDPAASSFMERDPVRCPAAVGRNVTEMWQVPAAGTLWPQSSVSEKS